jgi:hypothetical protein
VQAAAVALPVALAAAPAQAQESAQPSTYHNPQVAWVRDAHARGGTASVLAKYRCWGGNQNTHLWVSLKQGGGITGKTAQELSQMEGTSAIAAA